MVTALLLLFLVLAVSLGMNALLLWLSCLVCGVRRPGAATPDAPRRVVSLGRVFLLTLGVGITNLALLAVGPVLGWAGVISDSATAGLFLLSGLLSLVSVVVWMRFGLPTSVFRSCRVTLLWTVLSLVAGVALVLVVRLALLEAFTVPSGAMAETIYGYHKQVTCPQCGYPFAINASEEVERDPVTGCRCPNCLQEIQFNFENRPREAGSPDAVVVPSSPVETGDRILVGRGLLRQAGDLDRMRLIVFLYPGPHDPKRPAVLYVKRLIGLPGETVAIHDGDVYILPASAGLKYPPPAAEEAPQEMSRFGPPDRVREMHSNDPAALELWQQGRFEILRKTPAQVLALRHVVYDNDHPAKDLSEPRWQRWQGDSWKADGGHGFRHEGGNLTWLRYHHLLRTAPSVGQGNPKRQLILDVLGYNSGTRAMVNPEAPGSHWVGDLILECEAVVDRPEGELVLELSRGPVRFRARFDLANGVCRLTRQSGQTEEELANQPTSLKGGTHRLRFANVDRRLTVWVDQELPFGDGRSYDAPAAKGPTENDLEPASIAASSGVTVRSLVLWRDTWYTQGFGMERSFADPTNPQAWGADSVTTWYVQPGHYFCLGDNSPNSSDSRYWGLVPEASVRGPVLLRYYPFGRIGVISH